MEYISAEEFLKQDIDIQTIFMEWWMPKAGDLFSTNEYGMDLFLEESEGGMLGGKEFYTSEKTIPLLTEGQLRKFIEDKTECIINVSYKHTPQDGHMELEFDFYEYPSKDKYMIYISTKDIIASSILEAYWKVALEIAKEKVKA